MNFEEYLKRSIINDAYAALTGKREAFLVGDVFARPAVGSLNQASEIIKEAQLYTLQKASQTALEQNVKQAGKFGFFSPQKQASTPLETTLKSPAKNTPTNNKP